MSTKEDIRSRAERVLHMLGDMPYAAPELHHDRWRLMAELARGIVDLTDKIEAPPKTPEQMLAELRTAIGVPASDSHDDACDYAGMQAVQASRYREISDIVGDGEGIPF